MAEAHVDAGKIARARLYQPSAQIEALRWAMAKFRLSAC